jgi:1-phosphatidylinositol-4-phosphate 5-kinase
MLRAFEMPSFLVDDSGPNLALHYPSEPPGEHRNLNKTNGNPCPSYQQSAKESPENDSDHRFDSINGERSAVNGDMQNDVGLNSLPNGRSSGSSSENKLLRNGGALSVIGGASGAMENGRKGLAPNGIPRITDEFSSSANGGPIQPPTESSMKPLTNGDDSGLSKKSPLPPVSTNPPSTVPLTYNYSLVPATPLPDSPPARSSTTSPHRFSSPPTYHSNTTVTPTSSTAGPLQQPGSSQLKHRHTLQVPKPGLSRGSKDDGDDSAFASGRFSPTIATTGVRRVSLSLARRNTRSIHSDMPHEEIPPDEDALRWAEAIRQKRASKRRKKDEEDDDRVVVGTKVDQNHVNWVTAYNMLTGIRFTVSRTNAKLDRPLTDADFEQRHKFSFDM